MEINQASQINASQINKATAGKLSIPGPLSCTRSPTPDSEVTTPVIYQTAKQIAAGHSVPGAIADAEYEHVIRHGEQVTAGEAAGDVMTALARPCAHLHSAFGPGCPYCRTGGQGGADGPGALGLVSTGDFPETSHD